LDPYVIEFDDLDAGGCASMPSVWSTAECSSSPMQ
jgi:hypothetical protein